MPHRGKRYRNISPFDYFNETKDTGGSKNGIPSVDAMEEMIKAFSQLYRDGKYSDMTVICKGETFNVHKAIICSRSKWFAGAMGGRFKEGEESSVTLEDEDLTSVRRLLDFFYTLDYSDEPDIGQASDGTKLTKIPFSGQTSPPPVEAIKYQGTAESLQEPHDEPAVETEGLPGVEPEFEARPGLSDDSKSNMVENMSNVPDGEAEPLGSSRHPLYINAQMYVIADKYRLPVLQKLAASKFQQRLDLDGWDIHNFFDALTIIYDLPSQSRRDIQDIILATAKRDWSILARYPDFTSKLENEPEFTRDLLFFVMPKDQTPY